ncbi:MAG: amino acid permease [Deltaproteobacteria bacterium]|nr:amino acid permease [Deltaproteobacteria bacterium]
MSQQAATKGKAGRISLLVAILAYIGLIVSDPATSPFYAIESALGTVGYSLIVPTMLFVIAVAVSVSLGYIAIGIRFNRGEGGPGLIYEMLGIKPAMVAAASLVEDFVLTDAITMAATVAALVSRGVTFGLDVGQYSALVDRLLLAMIVGVAVAVVMRLGDKGRYIFASMTFCFMGLVLWTTFLPVLPNAKELMPVAHGAHIPDNSHLTGLSMIVVVLFGAVRGFALLTGFEASVAGLSHEEHKPQWVRITMGVGTVVAVLIFTSFVTYDIASTTQLLELEPTHQHTLFNLWTRSKLLPGGLASEALTIFSIGILLSGAASGAVAGSGMLRTLVKSKALPAALSNPKGTDYRSIFIVHGLAILVTLAFGADELKIVSFYAISVLVGFLLSLTAAVKFAYYTKTRYLLMAMPGLLMVAFALVVNMGRYEGWVIIGLALVMAWYLRRRWVAGGRQPINFSH